MLKEQELESKFSYLPCRTETATQTSKVCALQLCCGTQDNTPATKQMQSIFNKNQPKKSADSICTQLFR